MANRTTQVVVIGGGISGLSAANILHEAGIDVLVLEARDRVGGRTFTIQNDKCKWVDLGGAYVGPTQNRILRLARELGVKTYLVNERERLVLHENGTSRTFRGLDPPWNNPIKLMDINNFLKKVDEYGVEIPVDAPWNAPRAEEWDSITVKEWFDKIMWTSSTRNMAEIMVRVVVTAEPSEISLLWWLWYVKAGRGTNTVLSTTNGAQERKFDGGAMQISVKLAEKLGIGEQVLLSKAVNGIIQNESGAIVTTVDGSKYECQHIILATAPGMQMKIYHDPPLPPMRNQLIQRVPMGCVIKMHLYYEKAYWRESDMCGSSVVVEGMDHPVIVTLDDTKQDGSYPCIMGFLSAKKARKWVTRTKEERAKAMAKSMAKVFKNDQLLNYIHYEEKNWMEEQWSGGCYTACLPPNVLTQYGKSLRERTGRVHYAGTETAIHWSGYMEGAVQAGERAAREILFENGKIGKGEILQDEPEDQECFLRPVPDNFMERHMPSVPGFLKFLAFSSVTIAAVVVGIIVNTFK